MFPLTAAHTRAFSSHPSYFFPDNPEDIIAVLQNCVYCVFFFFMLLLHWHKAFSALPSGWYQPGSSNI